MGSHTNSRWVLRLLLVLSIVAGGGCMFRAVRASSESEAADAARNAYNQKTLASYSNHFGVGHPFLPSNATTDSGELIDPKSFPTAKYCGHCHEEAHTRVAPVCALEFEPASLVSPQYGSAEEGEGRRVHAPL